MTRFKRPLYKRAVRPASDLCRWCSTPISDRRPPNPHCVLYATLDGRHCEPRPAVVYTHCPEHGCELEPDGECMGCSGGVSDEDYAIFHD